MSEKSQALPFPKEVIIENSIWKLASILNKYFDDIFIMIYDNYERKEYLIQDKEFVNSLFKNGRIFKHYTYLINGFSKIKI